MISYRSQLLPAKPFHPGERILGKPDHLKLLDMIIDAAKRGQRCPSIDTIGGHLHIAKKQTTIARLFDRLVADGLIHIFRSSFGRVAYVVDLGICTERPRAGKNRPAIEAWYKEIAK